MVYRTGNISTSRCWIGDHHKLVSAFAWHVDTKEDWHIGRGNLQAQCFRYNGEDQHDYNQGAMQDYYEQHVHRQESVAEIKLSLVGTLGNFALNVFSPFVQTLVLTVGIKFSVLLATILNVAGLELSSFTTKLKKKATRFM